MRRDVVTNLLGYRPPALRGQLSAIRLRPNDFSSTSAEMRAHIAAEATEHKRADYAAFLPPAEGRQDNSGDPRQPTAHRGMKPVVRAALVTPLTGPLARYGQAGADALALWAEWLRECSSRSVDVTVIDAHPDPVAALRRAQHGRPDLLFGPYGSGPTAAVAGATERLVWNHGGARVPPVANVVSVLAPADTYFHGALRTVRHAADSALPTLHLLAGDTGFPRAVADGAATEARHLGFSVTRDRLTDDGTGAGGSGAEELDAGMLLVAGRFASELLAAQRLLPGRWRAAGFVGAGVEEVLSELGSTREGLLGPAQWVASAVPSPDEGPSAEWFVAAYRRRTGSDPSYPAAQAFGAGLIADRCLRDADSSDDAALLAAAGRLRCTTLFARFRIDPQTGRQAGHQVLTVQWQDGVRVVVWPPEHAQAPLRYPLV
jgi:branched-chain amino acid transport system substrate-binding protein